MQVFSHDAIHDSLRSSWPLGLVAQTPWRWEIIYESRLKQSAWSEPYFSDATPRDFKSIMRCHCNASSLSDFFISCFPAKQSKLQSTQKTHCHCKPEPLLRDDHHPEKKGKKIHKRTKQNARLPKVSMLFFYIEGCRCRFRNNYYNLAKNAEHFTMVGKCSQQIFPLLALLSRYWCWWATFGLEFAFL